MRILTFNVQNMRLRDRDGIRRLDGAVERDADPDDADPDMDRADRKLTAAVLHAVQADVVALQEVFDRATLDFFHDRYLLAAGSAPYPFRICLPGNDGSGLNVAAMSRIRPRAVRSHAHLTPADVPELNIPLEIGSGPIFRRDCLEIEFDRFSLYVCHFKAPYPDPELAHAVRWAEALTVRRIIEGRFPDPATARWVVLGDLNEPGRGTEADASSLAPLTRGFAIDLTRRLAEGTRWSFRVPDTDILSRPDRILISPALDRDCPDAVPAIFRAGMDPAAGQRIGGAFARVADPRPHASDHAAVYVDLPGLRA